MSHWPKFTQMTNWLTTKEILKIAFILVDYMPNQNLGMPLLRKKRRTKVTMKFIFQTETLLSCKRAPFINMPGQDTTPGTFLGDQY